MVLKRGEGVKNPENVTDVICAEKRRETNSPARALNSNDAISHPFLCFEPRYPRGEKLLYLVHFTVKYRARLA